MVELKCHHLKIISNGNHDLRRPHKNAQNVDKNEIFPILSQKETLFTISLGLEKKETQQEEMHCLQQTELRERREKNKEQRYVYRSQNTQESKNLNLKIQFWGVGREEKKTK